MNAIRLPITMGVTFSVSKKKRKINLENKITDCTVALSTPPRITIGFPMQNAEGPNSAKLSKNREFFENQ